VSQAEKASIPVISRQLIDDAYDPFAIALSPSPSPPSNNETDPFERLTPNMNSLSTKNNPLPDLSGEAINVTSVGGTRIIPPLPLTLPEESRLKRKSNQPDDQSIPKRARHRPSRSESADAMSDSNLFDDWDADQDEDDDSDDS